MEPRIMDWDRSCSITCLQHADICLACHKFTDRKSFFCFQYFCQAIPDNLVHCIGWVIKTVNKYNKQKLFLLIISYLIFQFVSTVKAGYAKQVSDKYLVCIKILQSSSSWSWKVSTKVVQPYPGHFFCLKNFFPENSFIWATFFPLDF